MLELKAIAVNTFREGIRQRLTYLMMLLALIVVLPVLLQLAYIGLAAEAGEAAMLDQLKMTAATSVLSAWPFFSVVLALIFGAMVLESEKKSKTIITAMARPVPRWKFLLGKWLGVQLYMFMFNMIGIAIGLAIIVIFGIRFSSLFWLGIVHLFVAAMLFSGASLLFSTFTTSMAAGLITFLLYLLSSLRGVLANVGSWIVKLISEAVYFLAPAELPEMPFIGSLSKASLEGSQFALISGVLLENFMYAIALFLIAALIFGRREILVR